MKGDSQILKPKAISGCICEREIPDSFMKKHKGSKDISRYQWDGGAKSFANRFSTSSLYKRPPLFHNERFVILFEGRVDEIKGEQVYRNQQNITEKELLSSYLKFGKDLPNRMYGDWSFAIYDRIIDELFISRDHNGNSVMHYTRCRNNFHFATLLGDLLENISIHPELDERRLVEINSSNYWKSERTYYKDIFRLPPGTSLIYNRGNIRLIQYWFPEKMPKIIYRNDSEYYDHFREIFLKAVENRIRFSSRPAVALSGGLDSGAVASVAASILEGTGRKLQTYTAIPAFNLEDQYKNRITNEWPIVISLIERYSCIDAMKFNSINSSPLKTAKRTVSIFREPVWAVSNYNWLFDLFERTKLNNDTLLFGTMGNRTISWPFEGSNFSLTDLLISDIKKFYSLAFRRRFFLEQAIRKSLLNPSIIKKHVLINNLIGIKYPVGIFNFHSILHKIINLRKNYAGAEMKTCSIEFDTNIFDPTNDRHVMEFVLNIPTRIFSNKDGSRLLVRKGLKEYMPQEYLLNKAIGIQSSDVRQRVELYSNDFLVELYRVKGKSFLLKYFDLNKIDQFIIDIKANNVSKIPINRIIRYMAAINFLEQFEEYK